MALAALLFASFAYGDLVQEAPNPGDYPATATFQGEPAKPVIRSKLANLYRTKIRDGSKRGPNFAGHYTVVSWGCGMDAYMFVVVDAKTGKVYEPPVGCMALAGGYGIPIAGFRDASNPGYRLDSKLIVVVGLEDGDDVALTDRAATVYLFDKGIFKRVFSAPAPLE